jgi:hypothetical protein
MTTVRMLPKCADGYCGWRACWGDATSAALRMRTRNGVADVRFCDFHRKCAVGGTVGIMTLRAAAHLAPLEAA